MNEDIKELNFEDALLSLEQLVVRLEGGDLALEQAMALFEEGQQLAALCNAKLEAAALRVEQLTADGEIVQTDVS